MWMLCCYSCYQDNVYYIVLFSLDCLGSSIVAVGFLLLLQLLGLLAGEIVPFEAVTLCNHFWSEWGKKCILGLCAEGPESVPFEGVGVVASTTSILQKGCGISCATGSLLHLLHRVSTLSSNAYLHLCNTASTTYWDWDLKEPQVMTSLHHPPSPVQELICLTHYIPVLG